MQELNHHLLQPLNLHLFINMQLLWSCLYSRQRYKQFPTNTMHCGMYYKYANYCKHWKLPLFLWWFLRTGHIKGVTKIILYLNKLAFSFPSFNCCLLFVSSEDLAFKKIYIHSQNTVSEKDLWIKASFHCLLKHHPCFLTPPDLFHRCLPVQDISFISTPLHSAAMVWCYHLCKASTSYLVN